MNMTNCHAFEIITPKKVRLSGLWFGPRKSKKVVVWVHGLGSSLFSKLGIIEHLARKDIAVLTFNNRGHDIVSRIADTGETKISKPRLGGSAHEVFEESADDIEGALRFARRAGAKKIYLAGHSTGCQKAIYWASKKNGGRAAKGIILLAPMSDYSGAIHLEGKRKIARAAAAARALLRRGKKHDLLPAKLWDRPLDAQRFFSLYSGEGAEEIFTYSQPRVNPRALKSVRRPLLIILAAKDEYADRSARKIADWFEKNLKNNSVVQIIKETTHSFRGSEKSISNAIGNWIKLS
ncbi:MAG TPA: alpha/beta fold hydrolase [Candidatus Paceibacterota bacterium]